MKDIFTFSRGKVLLITEDIYGRFFSDSRSKTSEHNIYERSRSSLGVENKTPQKTTETGENRS